MNGVRKAGSHLAAFFFRCVFKIKPFKYCYFGFYKRLFKPLNLFNGIQKKVRCKQGIKLLLDLDDWIPQNVYFLEEYEEKEMRFIERILSDGDCFVDIGANIGLFSLAAAREVGSNGRVIAFEPFKKNFDRLAYHIGINSQHNIKAEKLAISNKVGQLSLYLDPAEQNNGMVTAYPVAHLAAEETVPATLLDSYLEGIRPINNLRLIKIDIEGGEFPALLGMKNTLLKYRPTLLVEIDDENYKTGPYSKNDLLLYLSELGYHLYYLDKAGNIIKEKMSYDDSNNFVFSVDELQ
jgi:FkbM family methyltransferase